MNRIIRINSIDKIMVCRLLCDVNKCPQEVSQQFSILLDVKLAIRSNSSRNSLYYSKTAIHILSIFLFLSLFNHLCNAILTLCCGEPVNSRGKRRGMLSVFSNLIYIELYTFVLVNKINILIDKVQKKLLFYFFFLLF